MTNRLTDRLTDQPVGDRARHEAVKNALLVILSSQAANWLLTNDPKALQQALSALETETISAPLCTRLDGLQVAVTRTLALVYGEPKGGR